MCCLEFPHLKVTNGRILGSVRLGREIIWKWREGAFRDPHPALSRQESILPLWVRHSLVGGEEA